ncbi:MAG: hypothetical protein IKP73_06195 [Bacteroidales bacterium]|nr:hypothetical protein [Bacteroidales bacterium]
MIVPLVIVTTKPPAERSMVRVTLPPSWSTPSSVSVSKVRLLVARLRSM